MNKRILIAQLWLPVLAASLAVAAEGNPVAAVPPLPAGVLVASSSVVTPVLATELAKSEAVVAAPVVDVSAAELAKAQSTLKEKEAVIERLTKHLESALARINEHTGAAPLSTQTSALIAVKVRLEQENLALKNKNDTLNAQVAELSKKSQLLDLENRQLFAAMNSSYPSKAPMEKVASDGSARSSEHALARQP